LLSLAKAKEKALKSLSLRRVVERGLADGPLRLLN